MLPKPHTPAIDPLEPAPIAEANAEASAATDIDTGDLPPLTIDPYRPPQTTMVPTLRKYAATNHTQTDRSLNIDADTRECAPPTRRHRRETTAPHSAPSLDIPLLPPKSEAPHILPTPQRPSTEDITTAPLAPFQPLPTSPATAQRLAAIIRSYGRPAFIPVHSSDHPPTYPTAPSIHLPRLPAHLLTTADGVTYLTPYPSHLTPSNQTPPVIYATYSPIVPPSFLPYPSAAAPHRHYPDNTLAQNTNTQNTTTQTLDRLAYLWHAIHPVPAHPDPHNPPHPYPLDVIAHREHTRRTLLDMFPPSPSHTPPAPPPVIIECTPLTQPHPATQTLAATPEHITYRPPTPTFESLLAHNIPLPPHPAPNSTHTATPSLSLDTSPPLPSPPAAPTLVTLLDGMASILPLDPLAALLPELPPRSTLVISFRNTDTHPFPHPLALTPTTQYNDPKEFMRHPRLSNTFQHTHPKDPYLLLTATINDMI